MRAFWMTLCLGICAPVVASAQQTNWPPLLDVPDVARSKSADVAVLVGVEDYLFVPDVQGAKQNIVEWERFLRDGLGVQAVTVLVNEQATREEMLAAADAAAQTAPEDATVWYVFVGHGAPQQGTADGMLVGVDAQQTPRSIAARGVARDELIDRLRAGKQKHTFLLIDACFSGKTAGGESLTPGLQPMMPVDDAIAVPSGMVLMTAAHSNEFAGPLPGAERPAFSYLVLGGIRGWADDGDGDVSAQEAVDFAARELLTAEGRRQTPQVLGDTSAVLSREAREARPQAAAAVPTRPPSGVAASESTAPAPHEESDAFFRLALGAGGELTYESGSPILDLAWGVGGFRLNDSTAVVVSPGVSFVMGQNPSMHAANTAYGDFFDAIRAAGIPVEEISVGPTGLLGLDLGLSLQKQFPKFHMYASTRGGVEIAVEECLEFYLDAEGVSGCDVRKTIMTPAGGAMLGVGWKKVEVGIYSRFMRRRYTKPVLVIDGADQRYEMQDANELAVVLGATVGFRFGL